ncbi:HAD-IA family hydrolase [Cyanobacterium aponinum]|uniref:REG-2-like, HAD superfamily (Subfamily IA) hydrolase n=1 Tax=Cyanobacterium aponinum (strain PCC 10605) TaxID=755178 RepID=K9Z3M5_CYAAP|nr:HAD-IA family hydrolase [Cyanobacterium aponinum]AFZ53729.1 REG-2-like, HAD superfamily (subfamily IA) hydrolase [Cyanobacterium aponinum PCC 10605]
MNQPKVIFLDAVGTIFGVKNSVGDAYIKISSQYGVIRNCQEINQYFYECFKSSPPLAFKTQNKQEIQQLEYQWWEKIAYDTFAKANALGEFTDFKAFFAQLYDYFTTAEPWFIYDEVVSCLKKWQNQDIQLAMISNFDTRIYDVLKNLNLATYFQTITISSLTGVAKPHPQIFLKALEKHDCQPQEAWYIGDSKQEDYWGAKSVGMQSFWLNRRN